LADTFFPQSLTWSVHNVAAECLNSSVKGDAEETGLPNGNTLIRRRKENAALKGAISVLKPVLVEQCVLGG
jgi:hypothetical protein